MPEIERLALYKKIFVLVFAAFFSKFTFAQEYPDSNVDTLLKSGINFIITQKYDSAKHKLENLQTEYPQLPLGKIYLAALKIVKSNDLGENLGKDSIALLLDSAMSESQKRLSIDPNNIWNRYFLGLSEAYYAYYKALNNAWIPAFKNGLDAVSDFEKCLAENPKFFEAYAAIGTFKYWKSRKTEFLSWLPFVDNEENIGIKYLKAAINKSFYNRYLAINSLIWIYIDQQRYGNAIALAKNALKNYPNSRYFKWGLARAYEGSDKNAAVKVYSDILNSYKNENLKNHYKIMLLKYIIAKLYYQLGDDAKSLTLCNEILTYNNLSEYDKNKLGKRLEKIKEIKKELSK